MPRNLSELQEVFHFSFSRGTAIERYFANPDLFLEVVQGATELDEVEWSVGGNAALMAQKIAGEFQGTEVD